MKMNVSNRGKSLTQITKKKKKAFSEGNRLVT